MKRKGVFQNHEGRVSELEGILIEDAKAWMSDNGEDFSSLWLKPHGSDSWYKIFIDDYSTVHAVEGEKPYLDFPSFEWLYESLMNELQVPEEDRTPYLKQNDEIPIKDLSENFSGKRLTSLYAEEPNTKDVLRQLKFKFDDGAIYTLRLDQDYVTSLHKDA